MSNEPSGYVYTLGDIDSEERGTGARANSDKPRFELMPLYQLAYISQSVRGSVLPSDVDKDALIWHLSNFQRHREPEQLYAGIVDAALLMRGPSTEEIEDPFTLMDLAPVCDVWVYGLKKYAAFNWAKGQPMSVPMGCAMRHVIAYLDGEAVDPESGCHHLAHYICNLQMLLHFHFFYPEPEIQDLPNPVWFNPPGWVDPSEENQDATEND